MNKRYRSIAILLVVIVIVLFMFLINSKNNLVRQLQGPVEGTDSISTIDNKLSIISKDNHIYTWQWNDLKRWPVVAKPQTKFISPLNDNKIVYTNSSAKLILTDLKAEKELGNLSLSYGSEIKKIASSYNGKFGIISISENEKIKLGLFNSNFKDLSIVFEINKDDNLSDFAVNDEGNMIAGAGKNDKAWIFVKDIKNNKILWEKTFDEYGLFTIVKFSPDGKQIYAAEKVRFIIVLDAANGNVLKTYEMPEYPTPAHQKQNISCLAVSPNNKILAVDTEPAGTVWFWNVSAGQKIGEIDVGELTVSDIAFSPDGQNIATGCLVSPEIKIWKVPFSK